MKSASSGLRSVKTTAGWAWLLNSSSTSAESEVSKSALQIVRWVAGSLIMAPELQTSGASISSWRAIGQARR